MKKLRNERENTAFKRDKEKRGEWEGEKKTGIACNKQCSLRCGARGPSGNSGGKSSNRTVDLLTGQWNQQ